MKVLISGGGTAGHVNPAIAIGRRLKNEYNAKLLFVGKRGGLEERLVPKEGFLIEYIDVSGLVRKITPENIKVLYKYVRAIAHAKKIIRAFSPDVVVGTGGYVCAPVMQAARSLGIPVLVHEQNVFPGMTVKMAASFADCVAISFPDTVNYVSKKAKKACVLTGNPLRENMLDLSYEEARAQLNIGDELFVVTVGGSLGARAINEALIELISSTDRSVRILGGVGTRFLDEVMEKVNPETLRDNVKIVPYIDNMEVVLPAADLVVARAGAITVSELCALGTPAILIPSPNVTHNHQEYNARSVADQGAALLLCERDIKEGAVYRLAHRLLSDEGARITMRKKAKELAITDGTKRICEIVARLSKR